MVQQRVPAPKDGIQIYNGGRFRAIRGELMMPGATFEDPSVTEAAHQQYLADAAAKKNGGPSETTVAAGAQETTSGGHPKWYLTLLEKGAAAGIPVEPRIDGESEAAYKTRIAG